MASTTRIAELAALIKQQTDIVNDYFVSAGIPTPSLDATSPAHLSIPQDAPQISEARRIIIEATHELNALMRGPAELLRVPWTENVGLHAIVRFNIAKSFPVGETATFKQIAESIRLPERNVKRLLRHAMTSYLFQEPEKGVVAHTALTKLLAENEMVYVNAANSLDNMWPAACKVADALTKWPDSEEPNETAFSLANNTDESMWQVYKRQPERGEVFARGMGSMDAVKGYEPSLLIHGFPWETLGRATVVDLGGSHGSVMINLARAHSQLKCIVQDLPEVVEESRAKLPADVAQSVSLQAQNLDVGMLQLLNSHQRDAQEFRELFSAADARFQVVEFRKPPGGAQFLVEVMWS